MCKPKSRDIKAHNPNAKSVNQNNIKLLSFNVENLDPKLEEPQFLDLVNSHDVCILCETWKKDESKLKIPGFWDYSQIRPKTKKIGRYSGGITILSREEIRKGIKIVLNSEGLLWIKLEKKFFAFKNDLFVCASYIPPEKSKNSVGHINFFKKLSEQISKFKDLGDVFLAGDFNARIGIEKMEKPVRFLNYLSPDEPTSNSCKRSSCDHIVNNHGKKINRICNTFNLKVANGQVPGDLLGNYTCFHYNGCSLVDLIITSSDFINRINRLSILPPDFSSSHAPLSVDISCRPILVSDHDDSNLSNLQAKLIWDNSKKEDLIKLIEIAEVQNKLDTLNKKVSNMDIDKSVLEEALGVLCDILVTTSSKCMKLVSRGGKSRKRVSTNPKSKKWYDSECFKSKKRLKTAAKLLQSQPSNSFARGNYVKLKKEYRRLLKKNKMIYESDIIAQLEKLSDNPKAFWNHVKSLKSMSKGQ